ncbi:hypothetical protein ARSEF4850_003457 [Beauveria asiatica]
MSLAARIQESTPLDLIIDNDTCWISQLYMIRRAIVLRPFLEQLILKHRQRWEQENRSKRTGGARILEHLAKLLGFYEDAVRTLEGDGQLRRRKRGWVGSYGNVWEVVQWFEFLLVLLEKYKQLACGIPNSEHLRMNINLGWKAQQILPPAG